MSVSEPTIGTLSRQGSTPPATRTERIADLVRQHEIEPPRDEEGKVRWGRSKALRQLRRHWALLLTRDGLTRREVAAVLGCSHTLVTKDLDHEAARLTADTPELARRYRLQSLLTYEELIEVTRPSLRSANPVERVTAATVIGRARARIDRLLGLDRKPKPEEPPVRHLTFEIIKTPPEDSPPPDPATDEVQ